MSALVQRDNRIWRGRTAGWGGVAREGRTRAALRGSLGTPAALVAALAVSLCLPASVGAATTVKGKLPRAKGATLIGLSLDGTAVVDRLSGKGRFKLRFAGRGNRGASLQLVDRDGSYRGPVVLARKRRRAYTGISGKGDVGAGRIKLQDGYATTGRRASRRLLKRGAVDRRASARTDRKGRPVGAGKLGLLGGGRPARLASRGRTEFGSGDADALPGADPDRDGLPNSSDADYNGNGIIDQTDPDAAPEGGLHPTIFTSLPLEPEQAMNLNAAGVTSAQIDETLRERLSMVFILNPDDPAAGDVRLPGPVEAVDVDCYSLPYCRPGTGTALVSGEGIAPGTPRAPPVGSRWVDFDPDESGLPNLLLTESVGGGPPGYTMATTPLADTSQVRPGDSFGFMVRTGGGTVVTPATLTAYFVTTPAIFAYDDGSGAKTVGYPVQPGDPGTSANPAPLASSSLTLAWWRPQRPAIAGAESGEFIDMGGLFYGAMASVNVGGEERILSCTAADWSNPSSTLSVGDVFPGSSSFEALTDSAPDAAPDPANVLSATLDLQSCLARDGIDPAGKTVLLDVRAGDRARDVAAQFFHVRLP